jgi:hypothetical protein
MVPPEKMREFLIVITTTGERPDDLTAEEARVWDQLAREVADIERAGGVVDIPSDIPG